MARYASGRKSKAISDISGFKVRYTSLKTTYDNLRVEPSEFDVKHPQLTPAKNVFDATALFQPRPDNDPENVKFIVGFNTDIFASKIENSQKGIGIKGQGSVASLPSFSFNFGADSGVAVGTGALGSILINTEVAETDAVGNSAVGVTNHIVNTLVVTVAAVDGANKYHIGGSAQATVTLVEGNTYRFDQSASSNSGHPLRLSTTSNGSHGGGSEYTTGVTTNGTPGSDDAYTQITVAADAPTLYYYCTQHSAMGATANTPVGGVPIKLSVVETGVAGTGAIGTVTLAATPIQAGIAGTGAVGTEGIKISGWGNESWGDGTWGDD